MRNSQGKNKVVVFFVAFAMVAAVAGAALAGPSRTGLRPVASGSPTDIVQVAVQLNAAPTAVVYRQQLDLHSSKVSAAAAAVNHLYVVENEQADFRGRLRQAGLGSLYETFTLKRTYNAVVYVTTRDKIDALKKIPGVKGVHIMPPKMLTNARSIPFIGAPEIWNLTGALHGEGIKLGVIDTGLDYIHTTFGGSGLPQHYTANNTSLPTYNTTTHECGTPDVAFFPNAKAVGGIDLAGALYDVLADPPVYTTLPDCDPMDFHGHGTHVAGTATGLGVNGDGTTYTGVYDETTDFTGFRIGPGVAPLASLYGIKIIGDNASGSSGLVAAGVEWAVDPNGDGEFDDRLDVVNISFGGTFGIEDVESEVYRNAVTQLGLVLCISAGNSNDVYFIGGAPGSTPEVITVAASQHDGTKYSALRVNLPSGIAGDKLAGPASFGPGAPTPVPGNVVIAAPLNGCGGLTNGAAMAGNVALIQRGTCYFDDKVAAAQAAGAIGAIIYNNAAGKPFAMGPGSGVTITIPAVMISDVDGAAITAAINTPDTVNVTFSDAYSIIRPQEADNLASFSSRGPTRVLDHAVLKPDISAPGMDIMSALAQSGNLGESWAGTSMAAPHMTGVMALLRQLHPTWSPAQLKALVMNTADHDLFLNETDSPRKRMSPQRAGAGRVDLVPAHAGAIIAYDKAHPERVSLSFQTLDVVGQVTEDRLIEMFNSDTIAVTYDVTVDMATSTDGAVVTVPGVTQVTVPASGTLDVPVRLAADGATMIRRHDPTVSETMSGAPRYWAAEHSGWIVFTPTVGGAEPTLRVPFYALLNPASDMKDTPALATTGNAGTANLTLAGTGIDTWLTSTTEDFPFAPLSMVSSLEMLYASADESPVGGGFPDTYDLANTNAADLKYFGVGSNLLDVAGNIATTTVYFGMVTHGVWGSPREVEFDVYVKRRDAADWQYVILNYDQGVSQTNPGNDLMAVYQVNLTTGAFTPRAFLNGQAGSQIYLPVFMSDTMVFPIGANRLGLDANNSIIDIMVVTWGLTNGFSAPIDMTPILSYDVLHPGFVAPKDTLVGFPQPYHIDLPDVEIPINYNLTAARANMSGSILLLHWLNGMGVRGEMVPVDGLTCVTNADCPTWEKQFCEPMSGICLACVTNANCRGGEWCDDIIYYGDRQCHADCTAPFANPCAPGDFCNQATTLCQTDCRWQGATPCAPGSYCSTLSGLCVVGNALVKQTPELPGENCPTGGVKIETGIDDNGNGVLDYTPPTEVDQTSYVCNGLPTLVKAVDIPAGTGPCANGGQLIYAGVDDNADHVLQETEYDTFWYACNGLDGLKSIVKITDEAPGANCAAGGKKVETGVDDNADGTLQAGEVDHLEYVCNGVEGGTGKQALVSISDENPGDNCAAGGKKVEAGIDGNGDGVLQASEVDQTSYVCNGTDGSTGPDGTPGGSTLVTSAEIAPDAKCPNGSVLIKTGLDANGNGQLDDPDEILSMTQVCNGLNGKKGCSASPSPASTGPLGLLLLLGLLVLRRKR